MLLNIPPQGESPPSSKSMVGKAARQTVRFRRSSAVVEVAIGHVGGASEQWSVPTYVAPLTSPSDQVSLHSTSEWWWAMSAM